jgi:hypothetical protein
MVAELLTVLSLIGGLTTSPVVKNVSPSVNASDIDGSQFVEFHDASQVDEIHNANGVCRVWTSLYKHSYTEKSDLYLLSVNAMFCPGHDERANSNKQPDGSNYYDSYLVGGFLHLAAYQWVNKEYGGEITYKAISPLSSTFQKTITSSFGQSVSDSFSNKEGVKVSDAGLLSLETGKESSNTLSFTESESVSISSSEPVISASVNRSYDTKQQEAQWRFEFSDHSPAAGYTYWLKVNLLFEMSNNYSTRSRDAFHEYCHFSMTTRRRGFLGRDKIETNSGATGCNYFVDMYD